MLPLICFKRNYVIRTQADISLFLKQKIKAEVIEQVKAQMSEVLDKVLTDSLQSFSQSAHSNAVQTTERQTDGKDRRYNSKMSPRFFQIITVISTTM